MSNSNIADSNPDANLQRLRKRFFRFGLRSLLIVMALTSAAVGFWSYKYRTIANTFHRLEKAKASLDFKSDGLDELSSFEQFMFRISGIKEDPRALRSIASDTISDLSGFERFSNLEILYLGSDTVEDLSPLRDLKNLTSLTVSSPKLQDISPIKGCSNLRELDFKNTNIENFSVLSSLKKLTNLDLSNTPICDLSCLSEVTDLEILNLNETKIENLKGLGNQRKIKDLFLRGTRVKDLLSLKELHTLHKLDLYDSDLEELTSLPSSPRLYELVVGGPRLASISGLEQCLIERQGQKQAAFEKRLAPISLKHGGGQAFPFPKRVEIRDCSVSDLGPLKEIPGLKQLALVSLSATKLPKLKSKLSKFECRNVEISDFSELKTHPLYSLVIDSPGNEFDVGILDELPNGGDIDEDEESPSLTDLELTNVDVGNLKRLSRFKDLGSLGLVNCQASGFEHLVNLKELLDLTITNSGLKDIGWIAEIDELWSLKIQGSQISDLRPISTLRGLDELDLTGCSIENWSDLSAINSLVELTLTRSNFEDVSLVSQMPQLKYLHIGNTNVTDITPLMQSQTPTYGLDMMGLELSEPNSIWNLKWLSGLNISSCTGFKPGFFEQDGFNGQLVIDNIDVDIQELQRRLPGCQITTEVGKTDKGYFYDYRTPSTCF